MKAPAKKSLFRSASVAAFCLIALIALRAPVFSGAKPDGYEPDDSTAQARVVFPYLGEAKRQRHNFHDEGDQDWVEFCGLAGETYEIVGTNLGARSDLGLELYESDGKKLLMAEYWADENREVTLSWQCGRSGTYFVKCSQNDPAVFGKNTQYDLSVWVPIGPNGSGTMTGFIRDAVLKKPVKGLGIATSGKAAHIYNPDKGDYLLSDTAGIYSITLTARGYKTFGGKIEIVDSETTYKDFYLVPLGAPDLMIENVSGPSEGERGKAVRILTTVKNRGTADSGAFNIGIYLSKERVLNTAKSILIAKLRVEKLAAGAASKAEIKALIPAGLKPGTYYTAAVADCDRSVAEAREDNNQKTSDKAILIK